MADKAKQFNLITTLRLEYILASLTSEDYKTRIESLSTSIKEYDPAIVGQLDKYVWLVEKQLNGSTPSIPMLESEFPELNFKDVRPINDSSALTDYITAFVSQKKRTFISNSLIYMSDRVKTQGLTDEDTNMLFHYLDDTVLEDGYQSISENYLEKYNEQKDLVGISFLCEDLDKLTGGITPGQICTILGAPGSMKTTYSSNIAYNAVKEGKNVLYLSLEEPAIQLYGKWMSRCSIDARCPLPQKDIVQKKLDNKQLEQLEKVVYPMFNNYPGRLYIVDEQDIPDYKLTTLEAKFKEIDKQAREKTGHGIDLLVVDHIQLLKFAIPSQDTMYNINFYVSFFRKQSLNFLHEKRPISVILLSQANREGIAYAQRNGGQYQSQHIAEASEVERASSYIISVYVDSMTQVTNQLILSGVKLRGSALPASVIEIFADGSVYQVGTPTTSTPDGTVVNNTVDESTIDLNSIV